MTISFILHTSKTINPCLSQILDPFKLFWCFKAKEFLCRSVEGLLLLASDVILGFLLNFALWTDVTRNCSFETFIDSNHEQVLDLIIILVAVLQ